MSQYDQYDDDRSFGKAVREEASRVGSAIVRAVGDNITRKIVYDKQQLTATIPPDRGLIGRRWVVPPDEVHVVTGGGRTSMSVSDTAQIFGIAAEEKGKYWYNSMSSIVAMKTSAFPVTIEGLEVLDSGNTRYFVDVEMVAGLDPKQVFLAASKIGNNVELLISNILQRTSAELRDVAAKQLLADVIHDRKLLQIETEQGVRESLAAIGYTLSTLTIGDLRGEAVEALVAQSSAIVKRDATTNINAAELATLQSEEARLRKEAGEKSETSKVETAKRLEAQKVNETADIDVQEELAQRKHTKAQADETRILELAGRQQEVALQQIEFDESQALERADAEAAEAERRQTNEKALAHKAAQDDANRLDLVQERDLARATALTKEEAARLLEEETSSAERAKQVKTTQAEADARALEIRTGAETSAQLQRATTEADAAEKTAAAKTKMAAATRAEAAAPGLAEAEIEAARVKVAEQQVAVTRAEGLAAAEVAKEQAAAKILEAEGLLKVELERQQKLAEVFEQNPKLVELEMLKINNAQNLEVERLRFEAQVQMMQAMAPHMNLNMQLIGDGSRVSQLMAQVMAIATGAQAVGNEVPFVARMLDGVSNGTGPGLMDRLTALIPYVQQVIGEMQPKIFSTLTVAGLIETLTPVVQGKSDLATALNDLKQHGTVRMIADLPIASILTRFGIGTKAETDDAVAA